MGHMQFTDSNGDPLVGGTVGYYQQGTGATVLKEVWADELETTPLTNPVPLNSAGRPFSGGAETTVWGDGPYQQIVRNRSGVIVFTANIDMPSITADTISGNLTVTGNISAGGSISSNGIDNAGGGLNTPTINVTGNGSISGTLNAGAISATGGISADGNLNVGGAISVNGINDLGGITVAGPSNLAATSLTGALAMNGQNINSVGTVSANTVSATNYIGLPSGPSGAMALGGNATTNAAGQLTIAFSPPFAAGTTPAFVTNIAPDYGVLEVMSISNTSVSVQSQVSGGPQPGAPFSWVAVGAP
jgi:hypothetical protein